MKSEEEFTASLNALGYTDIRRLNINTYRNDRAYFKGVAGEKAFFIKRIMDKNTDTYCITDYIPDSISLRDLIWQGRYREALTAVPDAFHAYVSWIDRANTPGCCLLEEISAEMPKNPEALRPDQLLFHYWRHRMIESARIDYRSIKGRLLWLQARRSLRASAGLALVHGDTYAGNFLWDGKKIQLIDFEKVCRCDPNIDFAHLYTILLLHCRDNKELTDTILSAVSLFRKSRWFDEKSFATAARILLTAQEMKKPEMDML